jgi:hypothetical protein
MDITFMIAIILITIGLGSCILIYLLFCICKLVCCCIDEDLCRYLYNSCIFRIDITKDNKERIIKIYEIIFGSVIPLTIVSKLLNDKYEEDNIEIV